MRGSIILIDSWTEEWRRTKGKEMIDLKSELIALIQDEGSDLPTLSAVADKIISVASDPLTSAEELADVISYDQGMTNKLLKLANSIYYSQREKVDSVKRAISVVGFDEIVGICLGMKVFSSFKKKSGQDMTIESLWIHGISVALASKQMVEQAEPDIGRKIFIPGLLHDMGKTILAVYFSSDYQNVKRAAVRAKKPLYIAERAVFGLNHAELCMLLMKRWNFPESIIMPCRYHHDPESAPDAFRRHAMFINLADYLAHRAGIGKQEYPPPIVIKNSPEKIGISPAILKLTIDHLRRKEDEIREFYNLISE